VEPRAARRRRGRYGLRGESRVRDRGRLGPGPPGWDDPGSGDRLPCRSRCLRRTLRQPGLAAGAASTIDEADLGQRGPHEPGHRGKARRLPDGRDGSGTRHRRRRAPPGRPRAQGAGLDPPRSPGRLGDAPPGLWTHPGGTSRRRCRGERLRAAHQRGALVRRRPGGGTDRRDNAHGLHAGSLDHGEHGQQPTRSRRTPTSSSTWGTSRSRSCRCIPPTSIPGGPGEWPST